VGVVDVDRVLYGTPATLTRFGRELAPLVARALTGRAVEVRWCDPGGNRRGTAERRGKRAVVTVAPDLEGAEAVEALLHEIAHVKLHHTTQADRESALEVRLAEELQETHPERVRAWKAQREREAEALAERWCRWAADHASGPTPTHRLMALLTYGSG